MRRGRFLTFSIKSIECLIWLSEKDPIKGDQTLASQESNRRVAELQDEIRGLKGTPYL